MEKSTIPTETRTSASNGSDSINSLRELQAGKSTDSVDETDSTSVRSANVTIDSSREQTDDENDPGFHDDNTSTEYLDDYHTEYICRHGRTYHCKSAGAEYWAPNDDKQNETLGILHEAHALQHDGKLHFAPIGKHVNTAVDIGTGTGIWAMDFADMYPDIDVIGIDISPIQPGWVPVNLQFQLDGIDQPWSFKENSLGYVHCRGLNGSISDWPTLMKEGYRHLEPNGLIESNETSMIFRCQNKSVGTDSGLDRWRKLFEKAGYDVGRSFTVVEDDTQKTSMEEAGFTIIEQHSCRIPVGCWPKDRWLKDAGSLVERAFVLDTEGFLLYVLTEVLGHSLEETYVLAAEVREELGSPGLQIYLDHKVVVGQKQVD